MDILLKYFPDLTEKQKDLFAQMGELYKEWNAKINVISRKDIENLYTHHILHSMAIAKAVNFAPGTKILDAGTGGGLPGIPLAVLFPEVEFLLVDSMKKKITVASAISEALNLPNVRTQVIHSIELKEKFDFVTGRAVTAFPKFKDSVINCINEDDKNAVPNGIFYLKGGDFLEEIKPFKKYIVIHEISDYFSEEFFETKKIVYFPA